MGKVKRLRAPMDQFTSRMNCDGIVIEIAGGDILDLGVGDLFSLPPGVATTWHVTAPFEEMWVLASD